jgi:hypothetical protein
VPGLARVFDGQVVLEPVQRSTGSQPPADGRQTVADDALSFLQAAAPAPSTSHVSIVHGRESAVQTKTLRSPIAEAESPVP